jgi:Tfp pilus assembly protein PilN
LDIFREIGIEVKEIYSGEGSVINLTGMTLASKYRTFVLLIADNITLTTLLWVNGSFYYFNSTRCFNEQGTEEYAMEVARSVSQIIQFMMANQIEEKLETIRIAGIAGADTEIYQEALDSQGINIEIQTFDSEALSADKVETQRYLEASSGLVNSGKEQNFLYAYNGNKRKKNKEKKIDTGLLAVGAIFVIMLIVTLSCFVVKMVKQTQLDKLEAEINSPYVQEQVQQYDELLERNAFLARQYSAIAEVDENLISYPVCNNKIIRVIDDCSGDYATVTFESFQADEGLVTVTAKAENVDDINKFIRELNGEDIFNKVDYTGYSYDEQTQLWDIHVTCTLTEAAGR